MTGVIVKGVAGAYTVLSDGVRHVLSARGSLRGADLIPAVGDRVEFSLGDGARGGWLLRVLPRRNELGRPPVANLDAAVIALACASPPPDLSLADALLYQAGKVGVPVIIVANKRDLGEGSMEDILSQYAECGAPAYGVSAKTGEGLGELRGALRGKVFALCGQSGVGKSSLLNALYGTSLPVGELSAKIGRGKHTTRYCELIPVEGGGMALDTPGFSLIDVGIVPPDDIACRMTEFAPYSGSCRFSPCTHRSEPDCAVRGAAEAGYIHFNRWARYCVAYDAAEALWRRRYG